MNENKKFQDAHSNCPHRNQRHCYHEQAGKPCLLINPYLCNESDIGKKGFWNCHPLVCPYGPKGFIKMNRNGANDG